MKKAVTLSLIISLFAIEASAQKEQLLKELAENACRCIDSVKTGNLGKKEITKKINECIDKQVIAYQIGSQLSAVAANANNRKEKKQVNIVVSDNLQSNEYKKHYYEIERYLMDSCEAIKSKAATLDKGSTSSYLVNEEAMRYYYEGVDQLKTSKLSEAAASFEKAVSIDPSFAFAWDNLGISYRKLKKYDQALNAYQRSLKIDPKGSVPLQNIPVVYQYLGDYDKAIEAYKNLAQVDRENPEVFYGLGLIYTLNLKRYKDGLDNMCLAYNLYVAQRSPYRTDCEKVIQQIFNEMKRENNEALFYETLKQNNISTGSKKAE
ncbi:tetratricopeptide repeat protein [Desertivirga arenae]|uniref:tetratricopeptide repeat protein n=1 Tax=Desertivirga arenae TaxID=2810309 RepID=UPI001A95BAB2|nr:tetratricopeptide repeat protein [Pedobacter sp. SYSU D00823]